MVQLIALDNCKGADHVWMVQAPHHLCLLLYHAAGALLGNAVGSLGETSERQSHSSRFQFPAEVPSAAPAPPSAILSSGTQVAGGAHSA